MKVNTFSLVAIYIFTNLIVLGLIAGHKPGIVSSDRNFPIDKEGQIINLIPYNTDVPPVPFLFPLDPGFATDSIVLGPEILTGLQGWYDYKTKGEVNKYIQVDKSDPNYIHVIDCQTDSADPFGTIRRWTMYANSDNGGLTWSVYPNTPLPEDIKSGFSVLELSSDGAGFIATHTTHGGTRLDAVLYNEIAPHTQNFVRNRHPNESSRPYGVYPQICVFGNGNVGLLSRKIITTSNPPETLYYSFWNGTELSDRSPVFITGLNFNGNSGSNMLFNIASNGGSIGTAVAAPINENDTLGSSKVFFMTTTNSGINWSSPRTLFAPYTENNGEDTIIISGGTGLIYKQGTNHWFFAYPVSANGAYSTAKLVITKTTDGGNTLSTSTICTATQVGAATTYAQPIVFVFNIDFPALGWSDDGSTLYCVYSVVKPDVASSGWNQRDIYIQYSINEGSTWSNPIRITNTADIDESYPSISNWNRGSVGNIYEVNIIYMKDPGVGPGAFNGTYNNATPSLNKQIYRKLIGLPPIGIKTISNEVPYNFSLEQNYPNPFNPKTKIKFSLPSAGQSHSLNVQLVVYDILGKEVTTLVNEQLQPGIYNVEWDASNIPSGVYFYQIKTLGFTDTKKAILIK